MDTFESTDGTRLAYHRIGGGDPLICIPGGPMQTSAYLGDLGGLSAILLDLRGTGGSAAPADPATYRCDRQVEDIEALREHLGLDTIDLLGHSAGGTLAVLYAARHPDRVRRLVLVTPSPRVVDVEIADADRRAVAELRRAEPWFAGAWAAFERIWAGQPTGNDWTAITPFMRGRWDAANQAHAALEASQANAEAAGLYYSAGAFDPAATRSAVAKLPAPVLLLAGQYDAGLPPKNAAEFAGFFANAELTVQPAAGHYPWLDNPTAFRHSIQAFLHP